MHPSVRLKLLGLSATLLAFLGIANLIALVNLATTEADARQMYDDGAVPLQQLGTLSTTFMDLRRLATAGVMKIDDPAEQANIDTAIAADRAQIDQIISAYAGTDLSDAEKAGLADLNRLYPQYMTGLDGVRKLTLAHDGAGAMTAITTLRDTVGAPLTDTLEKLASINADGAKSLDDAIAASAADMRMFMFGGFALALLCGAAVALWLSNSVVRSVSAVQRLVRSLAEEDLTHLAEGMSRLREGDLTYAISVSTPRIEKYGSDEVGRTAESANEIRDKVAEAADAYNAARAGLAATIREVQSASEAVSTTSQQLSDAAAQSGAATQQIATTIGQVAGGTAEQARAASDTNAAVGELGQLITELDGGAQAASSSIEHAMAGVRRMRESLAASDAARSELGPVNERAAAALDQVTSLLGESAAGMARIKTAVDESAVKVAELGAKGEQIGAIVETIDDIAAQTNLLALNAAIEAARAGEMGKGFAVVADEVRKLAERSGRATKEIAELIAEVQHGTTDAVAAMNAGAAQVETGLEIGRRSSASVEEILEATRTRNAGATKVYGAMDEIASVAGDMAQSSEEIAAVVSRAANTASRMSASSEVVRGSVGSIAAVSEENSAAAEEVSAATEEMSAQAEEVVASAATLADMAARLDALVARFRLDDAPTSGAPATRREAAGANIVQRRRAGDWTQAA